MQCLSVLHTIRKLIEYSLKNFCKSNVYSYCFWDIAVHNYQNKLDNACFQHDIAYGNFEDLPKRKTAGKVLRGKAFSIAKSTKYNAYQRGLGLMF